VKTQQTGCVNSPSKLLDLRDCDDPSFRRQYAELESLQWASHGLAARLTFRLLRKDWKLRPIWSRRWEYPWAIQNGGLGRGLTVLDAGCGGSPLLPYLAQQWQDGLCLKGVDKGVERVLNWKGRLLHRIGYRPVEGYCSRLNRRIEVLQESLDAMSFRAGFFDRIFCISVLEHIPQDRQPGSLRELGRVLKPGGLLLVTMDLNGRSFAEDAERLVMASGLSLVGSLDYFVPRSLRHSADYEVLGVVFTK